MVSSVKFVPKPRLTGNLYLRVSEKTKADIKRGAKVLKATQSEFVRFCVEAQLERMEQKK